MAWSWITPSDVKVAALLLEPMKALERWTKDSEKYLPICARVATTNATVTTLYTHTVPPNHTVVVEGYVVARRTGGSAGTTNDAAAYRVTFAAKNTSGTAALVGAGAPVVIGEDQAAWACTVDASAGTIRVRVTGAANNNISWRFARKSVAVMNEE